MATKNYRANEDYNVDWTTFRNRLQKLLDSKGMNKADLSRATDLSISTITRYFYESTPDTTALCILADYFGVTLDYLLGRSNERWIQLQENERKLLDLYTLASESDKAVIQTLLAKYETK